MLNQFSRTQLLYGADSMAKLQASRVAVFGIGGVGGYVVEALVRSGVGAIDLIDDDKVCLTNINRQILATRKTVGKYKVDVAEERIHEINPDCEVRTDEKTESEITEQIQEQAEISPETRHIVLQINGNTVRAYDYSDALNKVCEFAINCKPFEMANITRQYISLNEYNVFCRHAELIGGYNRLSNGLQVTKIGNISDLQKITNEIKKYCQIDDDMIKIISK